MTNFLGFGMNLTDQVFVGHLSKEALAAAAVSNLLYNLPFFFVVGYCTALDTLGAQAYGRRSAASLKAWASTAALHMAVLSVPTCAILLCGQPLAYHLLGQSAEVAAAVGTFCALLAPGALFMALFMVLQKYLQVQNILWPPAVLAFGANLCNIFFNAAFIHWAGLGIVGAPLATTASRILQCLCLWAYILRYHPEPRVPELGDLLDSGEAAQPPAAATVAAAPGDGGTDEVEAGSGVSSGLGGAVFWRAFLYPLAAPVLWLRRRPEWLTHTANRTFLRLGVAGGFMLGLEVRGPQPAPHAAGRR